MQLSWRLVARLLVLLKFSSALLKPSSENDKNTRQKAFPQDPPNSSKWDSTPAEESKSGCPAARIPHAEGS
jgi:hypothetical protein